MPAPSPSDRKRLSSIRSEAEFLAGRDAWHREAARLWRILTEFVRAYFGLRGLGPAVTVFGSARFKDDHRYYALARKLGAELAGEGYTVICGGGPGIMEAVSRGAKEAGGTAIGCNIRLPFERVGSSHLDRSVVFRYFFVRKVMLLKYSQAFVILPGGIGTLDELTEALTLIQTGKLYDFPVILMGKDFWQGWLDWVRGTMVREGALSERDLDFVRVTDDPAEAARIALEVSHGIGFKLQKRGPRVATP